MSQGKKATQGLSLLQYKDYKKQKWGMNRWCKVGNRPLNHESEQWRLQFHEKVPLKLRNFVVGRSMTNYGPETAPCVPQMLKMFECMAINDHNEKNCMALVNEFQDCTERYLAGVRAKKLGQVASTDVFTPNSDKISSSQVNALLKRFPQKNKT